MKREAILRYGDGGIQMLQQGEYVICAVTGEKIALEDLRYWSVERQEAYVDATASLAGHSASEEGV